MKSLPYLVSLIIILHTSCNKCELLEQVIIPPVIDTVACKGTFYANRNGVGSTAINFNFIEFKKPWPEPFVYTDREGPNPVNTTVLDFTSNFSAYDDISNSYVFLYYYTMNGTPFLRFHHHDINTSVSVFTNQMDPWVSPVILKGKTYGIRVIGEDPATQYEILEINPITGQRISTLSLNNIIVNSPFTSESMSSTSDGGNNLYFLSGTNLIYVKASSGNATHIDIDPSFTPNNNVVKYYGVEYKADEDVLLAMKSSTDANNTKITDLVSISLSSGLPVVKLRFDIHNHLPANQNKEINPEFYSTTFDPCDGSYYVTEIQDISPNLTSNLLEINLKKNTQKNLLLGSYWYGLEFMAK